MSVAAVNEPEIAWPAVIGDQLQFHWSRLGRPRLDGLTDDEYLWEPVPDCWSLRRRPARVDGSGRGLGIDAAARGSAIDPVTTIAWRLGHLIVDILGARTHRLFDGPAVERDDYPFPETAESALKQLDDAYLRWSDGVTHLTEDELARPCGPEEPYFQGQPLATLLLHVNRELLCHCAEVALLMDLYAHGSVRLSGPRRTGGAARTLSLDLTIRDVQVGDMPKLAWSGSPLHVENMSEHVRTADGSIDYIAAFLPTGEAVGKGEIDYLKRPDAAEIGSLAVHGLVQSQGIGSLLIETAEERIRARGLTSAIVGVEEDNPRARSLYERLGYKVVGSEADTWDEMGADGSVFTHRTVCTFLSKTLS